MSLENPKDGWNLNDSFSKIGYFLQDRSLNSLFCASRDFHCFRKFDKAKNNTSSEITVSHNVMC